MVFSEHAPSIEWRTHISLFTKLTCLCNCATLKLCERVRPYTHTHTRYHDKSRLSEISLCVFKSNKILVQQITSDFNIMLNITFMINHLSFIVLCFATAERQIVPKSISKTLETGTRRDRHSTTNQTWVLILPFLCSRYCLWKIGF